MTARELELRRTIMTSFAATGEPPAVRDEPALRALADRHVVVLEETERGAPHIVMAHPFAAHRAGARVDAGERSWWGNCAWDACGIVAALDLRDARITDASGVTVRVEDGRPLDRPLFHVAVPARDWWADIGYT